MLLDLKTCPATRYERASFQELIVYVKMLEHSGYTRAADRTQRP